MCIRAYPDPPAHPYTYTRGGVIFSIYPFPVCRSLSLPPSSLVSSLSLAPVEVRGRRKSGDKTSRSPWGIERARERERRNFSPSPVNQPLNNDEAPSRAKLISPHHHRSGSSSSRSRDARSLFTPRQMYLSLPLAFSFTLSLPCVREVYNARSRRLL